MWRRTQDRRRWAKACLRACLVAVLWIVCAASLPVGSAYAAKRFALVIGNSQYENAPDLPNAANDAEALGEQLEKLGFVVKVGIDLDNASFSNTVSDFRASLKAADAREAVFFYAGHGFALDGYNHLVPVDAKLKNLKRIPYETLQLDEIIREIQASSDQQTVIFLDACRNSPLPEKLRDEDSGDGLAQLESATSGIFVAFAAQPGKVTRDGKGKNSPFTGALLKYIAEPGSSVSDLLIKVRSSVRKETLGEQIPWDQGSLFEPFYFKRTGTEVAALAPAEDPPATPPADTQPIATPPVTPADHGPAASTETNSENSGGYNFGQTPGDVPAAQADPVPAKTVEVTEAPVNDNIASSSPQDIIEGTEIDSPAADPNAASSAETDVVRPVDAVEADQPVMSSSEVQPVEAVADVEASQPGAELRAAETTANIQPGTPDADAQEVEAGTVVQKQDSGPVKSAEANGELQPDTKIASLSQEDGLRMIDPITELPEAPPKPEDTSPAIEGTEVGGGEEFGDSAPPSKALQPIEDMTVIEGVEEPVGEELAVPPADVPPGAAAAVPLEKQAEQKQAALTPPAASEDTVEPTPPVELDRPGLVEDIQKELTRLGCFSGKIDGAWNSKSASALGKYYQWKGKQDGSLEPMDTVLEDLKNEASDEVCVASVRPAAPKRPTRAITSPPPPKQKTRPAAAPPPKKLKPKATAAKPAPQRPAAAKPVAPPPAKKKIPLIIGM